MQTEKLCGCGCGNPAPIAQMTCARLGVVKGQPSRFIRWHHGAIRHGLSKTVEHNAFRSAKARCTNPNNPAWKDYGGRGIKFLFESFEQFLAELGSRPAGKSLDRFPNNDGNYEPGNVRWATRLEQASNRRPYGTAS